MARAGVLSEARARAQTAARAGGRNCFSSPTHFFHPALKINSMPLFLNHWCREMAVNKPIHVEQMWNKHNAVAPAVVSPMVDPPTLTLTNLVFLNNYDVLMQYVC